MNQLSRVRRFDLILPFQVFTSDPSSVQLCSILISENSGIGESTFIDQQCLFRSRFQSLYAVLIANIIPQTGPQERLRFSDTGFIVGAFHAFVFYYAFSRLVDRRDIDVIL